MVRFVSGALAFFALLSAAASGAQRPEARSTEARCFTVWVRAEGGSGSQARRFRRFTASELLDLRFHVLLPSSQDIENVELKLVTPRGHLYQALDIPVDAEPDEGPRQRRRFRWVSGVLPVAGTTIVTSSLYGRWRAEAYLDGSPTPCGRSRTFTLDP